MTPAEIQAGLLRIAGELAEYADEISQLVPEGCDRYAAILEAWNRTGGASAETKRAAGAFSRAIQDAMGGE